MAQHPFLNDPKETREAVERECLALRHENHMLFDIHKWRDLQMYVNVNGLWRHALDHFIVEDGKWHTYSSTGLHGYWLPRKIRPEWYVSIMRLEAGKEWLAIAPLARAER